MHFKMQFFCVQICNFIFIAVFVAVSKQNLQSATSQISLQFLLQFFGCCSFFRCKFSATAAFFVAIFAAVFWLLQFLTWQKNCDESCTCDKTLQICWLQKICNLIFSVVAEKLQLVFLHQKLRQKLQRRRFRCRLQLQILAENLQLQYIADCSCSF